MINSANSLHILHRVNTELSQQQQSSGEESEHDSDNLGTSHGSNNSSSSSSQDEHPEGNGEDPLLTSLLLPRGLEYEVASCDQSSTGRAEGSVGGRLGEIAVRSGIFSSRECKLSFFFVMLVLTGVGNILSAKLQAVSMYNYGVFLSLFSYIFYVPLCFAFILPTAKYGWFDNIIPPEHMALPKRPFAIMGFLDCLAAVMQTFASIYLPGSLLVLLPQAAIPLSMVLSKNMVGERYRRPQYIGAAVVFVGVLLVLEPTFTHRHVPNYLCEAVDLENHCTLCKEAMSRKACLQIEELDNAMNSSVNELMIKDHSHNAPIDIFVHHSMPQSTRIMQKHNNFDDQTPVEQTICQWIPVTESTAKREWSVFIWSIVIVLSCVPMTMSSVYKQIKLRAHGDLHPVFLIGWIGVFQLLFSIISAPAVVWATGMPLSEVPRNAWDGLQCYFGYSSVELGCHPDSHCGTAFFFVNLCITCQALYMLCVVFVLKYGSTSLLYLALTMMVPLGNLIFSLPIVTSASIYGSDILALVVIVLGLLLFRFGHKLPNIRRQQSENDLADGQLILAAEDETDAPPCHPLLDSLISYAYV